MNKECLNCGKEIGTVQWQHYKYNKPDGFCCCYDCLKELEDKKNKRKKK